MKKLSCLLLSSMLILAFSVTAFAGSPISTKSKGATVRMAPPGVVIWYDLENVEENGEPRGYGSWKSGPAARAGSSGGTITKTIEKSFKASISAKGGLTNEAFEAIFNISLNQEETFTSSCTVEVPPGKTIYIKYRGLYQFYTADLVRYRVIGGSVMQEIGRRKTTIRIPVDIEFKW